MVAIGDSPAALHHRAVQVDAAGFATCEQPVVAVAAPGLAHHRPSADQFQQRVARFAPAGIVAAWASAGLAEFRRIDADQSQPRTAERQGIAVHHPRHAGPGLGRSEALVPGNECQRCKDRDSQHKVQKSPDERPWFAPARAALAAPQGHRRKGLLIIPR